MERNLQQLFKYPKNQNMRLLILTLLLVVTFINEGTGAQLKRISQTQSAASIKIYTFFDNLPFYRQRVSDKRLDLTFYNTSVDESLQLPEPDDVIIKTLVTQDQGKTTLSVFFRYIPQNLVLNADQSDTLVVDLTPGNRFTGTYTELRSSLGQVSPVPENRKTIVSPLTFSLFSDDWLRFFENYSDAPFLQPSPSPYFPPFPLTSLVITGASGGLDKRLPFIEGLDQNDWFESLRLIQKQLKSITKGEDQKYYAITHADILVRLGSDEAALNQFKLLNEAYKNNSAGNLANYAWSLIRAKNQDFYIAQTKLRRLYDLLPGFDPLLPYVRLALAEIALATNQYKQMKQYLDSMEEMPASLRTRVQLRTADLAFATGRFSDAHPIYRSLYDSSEMTEQPYSINGYCSILLSREFYNESFDCYRDLASLLDNKEQAAQAHYLAALSEMLVGELPGSSTGRFNQIIQSFPTTSAALRAELKQADSCYLQQHDCADNIQAWYRNIAAQATARDIAHEAYFKEALVYHLSGDNRTTIQLLSKILRTFQSGDIRDHVQALLIQILPDEIKQRFADGRDIEAIALAQQNRFLFEKGWLENSLLFRIGLAFENLAMYPEALQLFLYLKQLDNADNSENIHLASTRAAHALGEYHLVEDLATEYFYQYPKGKHQLDILFYRLDCRYGIGHIDEALKLLPSPLPQRDDFRFAAASLYFQRNDYARTVDILLPVYRNRAQIFSDDHLYILAESLFNLKNFTDCSALFKKLSTTDGYRHSARFRLAQITEPIDKKTILDLPVAGNDESSEQDRWHRFAMQDLRYKDLLSTL